MKTTTAQVGRKRKNNNNNKSTPEQVNNSYTHVHTEEIHNHNNYTGN